MRLKFIDGKQKELLNRFRKENNFTWNEFAGFLGIKSGRLKSYFDETSLISEDIYEKIDINRTYNKFILEKIEENWGKKKGGKISLGNTKQMNFPRDSKELAEFYGIMLGDGNSHRTSFYNSQIDKRGTYMIRIVGDSRHDKDYLINYVKPLMENLFGLVVKNGKFKESNAMFLVAYSKRLIEFLELKEFKPGDKIKNKLGIPNWIKENEIYSKACLRGLYDTDGSVYRLTGQNSHQICFTNYNLRLMKEVRDSLLKLGINCSKISNKDIYITKKSELRKFLKLIGFNNYRHLKKIKMWNLDSPVV